MVAILGIKMKKQTMKESMQGAVKPIESSDRNSPEFNFDAWAKQVRPLLLASVSKRGNR